MTDWTTAAADWWGEQPHPQAPGLKIKEFPTAVKLATHLKFGGHASPAEATAFWREFQGTNEKLAAAGKPPLSPEEMEHLVDRVAPLSATYHGRPPTMQELVAHREAPPEKVRAYYHQLPDQHYPDVPAGEMVKHMVAAEPHAQEHLSRDPVKREARYLYHSGHAPSEYYQSLRPPEEQQAQQPQLQVMPGGQDAVPAQAR
jgi:hypothetical protein